MREEVPEVAVHCVIQCQSKFQMLWSTVLYTARGGSRGFGPLFYREPEQVPQVPVHYRVLEDVPEVLVRSTIECIEEVPEVPVRCIRRFQRFRYTVLYTARRESGGSGPLCYREGSGGSVPVCFTMPEEVPEVAVHCILHTMPQEVPVHCIVQCRKKFWKFRSIVLHSAREGSGPARSIVLSSARKKFQRLRSTSIIQCHRRFHWFRSTVFYSGAGSSRSFGPLYYTKFWSTVLYNARGGSGVRRFHSAVLYSAPEEVL